MTEEPNKPRAYIYKETGPPKKGHGIEYALVSKD